MLLLSNHITGHCVCGEPEEGAGACRTPLSGVLCKTRTWSVSEVRFIDDNGGMSRFVCVLMTEPSVCNLIRGKGGGYTEKVRGSQNEWSLPGPSLSHYGYDKPHT